MKKNRASLAKAGILFILNGANGVYPDERLIKKGLLEANPHLQWASAEKPPRECVQDYERAYFFPLAINGKSILFENLSDFNDYINQKFSKAKSLEETAADFCQVEKRFRMHIKSAQAAIFFAGTIPTGDCFLVKD